MRDVVVAFVDRSHVETSENLERSAGLRRIDWQQRRNTDWLAHLLERRRGCRTVQPHRRVDDSQPRLDLCLRSRKKTGEPACARQIAQNLARRAFRRPVTTEDMNRLMPFYEAERRNGGTFDQGIEQIVAAVLVSPQFLYRTIRGPVLTDLELASRLSFFLWNTGPDEELLTLASANGLTRPGVWRNRCAACSPIPGPPA